MSKVSVRQKDTRSKHQHRCLDRQVLRLVSQLSRLCDFDVATFQLENALQIEHGTSLFVMEIAKIRSP